MNEQSASTSRILRAYSFPLSRRCLIRTLNGEEIEEGPAVKKRKLGNGASTLQGVQSQPSFADVLEKLKEEEGTNAPGMVGLSCSEKSAYSQEICRGGGWSKPLGTPKTRRNRS